MDFTSHNAPIIRKIADALLSTSIGETITYAALDRAAGVSVQARNYLLQAAMRLVNKESGVWFGNVRGVGYVRHTQGEVGADIDQGLLRVRRIARRKMERSANAVKYGNDISDEQLRTIYSRQAAIGLIQHMTYQRNLPVIPPGTAPPPTVDTIRSSMEALRSHSKFQKK
jgi:hypothetical protein